MTATGATPRGRDAPAAMAAPLASRLAAPLAPPSGGTR